MSDFILSGAEHGGETATFSADIAGTTLDLDCIIANKKARYELRSQDFTDGSTGLIGIFIGYVDIV